MAHDHRFDSSRTRVIFVAVLALMALPLGCQSDPEDEPDDTASPGADEPDVVAVPPRDDAEAPRAPASRPSETPAANPPAAAAAAPSGEPDGSGSTASAPAQTFAACAISERTYGTRCDTVYVTMQQASPARCVQLSIDNCGTYDRQGLRVDAPLGWRLASGAIGLNFDECELGVFYPDSDVVVDASGTISWNEATPLPSELVLELTLEPTSLASDTASVDVVTSEPLEPSPCPSE
jgi:hypothetical protein